MGQNIYLTGFSCTGKTTVGKLMSKKNGLTFIDLDEEIELSEHESIPNIFSNLGEEYFRGVETLVLEEASLNEKSVISTGGGLPTIARNRKIMNKTGVVILLTASAETIFNRLNQEIREFGRESYRPVIDQNSDKLQGIIQVLKSRESSYQLADICIDTENKTPDQISDEIIEELFSE